MTAQAKKLARPYPKNKPGVVVLICNPSYTKKEDCGSRLDQGTKYKSISEK
jgi:hypothetical protein